MTHRSGVLAPLLPERVTWVGIARHAERNRQSADTAELFPWPTVLSAAGGSEAKSVGQRLKETFHEYPELRSAIPSETRILAATTVEGVETARILTRIMEKVLINGAGGAVGTFAVQLAKAYGANVTGVDATGKLDMLRSIGADQVLDYTQEDFTLDAKSSW